MFGCKGLAFYGGLLLLAMVFIVSNAPAQGISSGSNSNIFQDFTGYIAFGYPGALWAGQYGNLFSQMSTYNLPNWPSLLQSYGMPLYYPQPPYFTTNALRSILTKWMPESMISLYEQGSSVPFGCVPVWEKRRMVDINQYVTPLYCPIMSLPIFQRGF